MARRKALIGAASLVAWLAYVAHNVVDLPGLRPWSPEYALVTLVWGGLLAWWWRAGSAQAARAYLAWALLQLFGGALLSVLPLPILPFLPAQTPIHYAMHAIYGVALLPLVILLWREARRGRPLSPASGQA